MKNIKIKVIAAIFSSLFILTGCEQPVHNQNATAHETTETVQPSVSQSENFSWDWLSKTTNSVVEESTFNNKNYYFVLDGSGSMDSRPSDCNVQEQRLKIDIAKEAIEAFINKLPNDVNIGLVAFDNSGISERFPLTSGDKEGFLKAMNAVAANSSTPLRSSIQVAYDKIKQQGLKQSGYGEYNLIVLTDGEYSGWDENPESLVKEISIDSPVNTFAIGFCVSQEHSLNLPNDVYFFTANDSQSILESLDKVVAESEAGL